LLTAGRSCFWLKCYFSGTFKIWNKLKLPVVVGKMRIKTKLSSGFNEYGNGITAAGGYICAMTVTSLIPMQHQPFFQTFTNRPKASDSKDLKG
jgi:hypothetical protein